MELERWAELSAAISAVEVGWKRRARDRHSTALIVRVHLWAVSFDRPMCWACDPRHWRANTRPEALPDQSTMSRRTRRDDFEEFLKCVGQRLAGKPAATLVKLVDGKPLELPNHSRDRDATWSRGVGRTSKGYKLHAIYAAGNPMPVSFVITTLNVCEKQMAARMLARVNGGGYLLADAHYDASWLFDYCNFRGHRLLCPRAKPGTGLGHGYQSPHRLRAIDLLEDAARTNDFGPTLYAQRTGIEREFSGMVCFGGGLGQLPTWVRRIWRVRNWVTGKLLVNAARVRINQRQGVTTRAA